jgi:hypothetical protein
MYELLTGQSCSRDSRQEKKIQVSDEEIIYKEPTFNGNIFYRRL